jgi:hypothetical protein
VYRVSVYSDSKHCEWTGIAPNIETVTAVKDQLPEGWFLKAVLI